MYTRLYEEGVKSLGSPSPMKASLVDRRSPPVTCRRASFQKSFADLLELVATVNIEITRSSCSTHPIASTQKLIPSETMVCIGLNRSYTPTSLLATERWLTTSARPPHSSLSAP